MKFRVINGKFVAMPAPLFGASVNVRWLYFGFRVEDYGLRVMLGWWHVGVW